MTESYRRRDRSYSPVDDMRHGRRRSISPRGGDLYVPDYDRDGYVPAPKYRGGDHDRIVDPSKVDYLVSYRHFAGYMRSKHGLDSEDEEVSRRYQIYKTNFKKKFIAKFFESNKTLDWFKERYHPSFTLENKKALMNRKIEQFEAFEQDLKDGKFDGIVFDEPEETFMEEDKEKGHVDQFEELLAKQMEDPSEETPKMVESHIIPDEPRPSLFLWNFPKTVTKTELTRLFKDCAGLKEVIISDPIDAKKSPRFAWIVFDSFDHAEEALKSKENAEIEKEPLTLSLNRAPSKKAKLVPSELKEQERLAHDLSQIKQLVQVLDKEADLNIGNLIDKRVATVAELMNETDKLVKKNLDLYILYLRRVHFYSYYSGIECTSKEDAERRCAVELRQLNHPSKNPNPFIDALDDRAQLRINPTSDLIRKAGGRIPEEELEDYFEKTIKKEAEEKYRCRECLKLFKGPEFVQKHIRSKHAEIVDDILIDAEYFTNFVLDTGKIVFFPSEPASTFTGRRSSGARFQREQRMDRRGPRRESGRFDAGYRDGRPIKNYVDLDAPGGDDVEISYD